MSVGKRTKSAGDLIILSPLYVYIYILFLNLNTRSFFRCVYVPDSRVSSVSDETQQSCDQLLAGSSLRRWSAARSHHTVWLPYMWLVTWNVLKFTLFIDILCEVAHETVL